MAVHPKREQWQGQHNQYAGVCLISRSYNNQYVSILISFLYGLVTHPMFTAFQACRRLFLDLPFWKLSDLVNIVHVLSKNRSMAVHICQHLYCTYLRYCVRTAICNKCPMDSSDMTNCPASPKLEVTVRQFE